MRKVIVITGGSRGIGAATAKLAASRGYKVCINYRNNKKAAHALIDEMDAASGDVIAVSGDVSLESDVSSLFKIVDDKLGPITALVNNAGIVEKQMRVVDIDSARLSRILNTNVIGSFLCAKVATLGRGILHDWHIH